MYFQFDVYRNPSEKTNVLQPYIMVIQHDYYDDLSTRLIVPLCYRGHSTRYHHQATPRVNIEFQSLFMNTPGITSVEKKRLSREYFVCNLKSARPDLIAALDALITNT